MSWLRDPFLPNRPVTAVLIDRQADKKIISALEKLGIEVYLSYATPTLSGAIASHPDMSIFPLGNGRFVAPPEAVSYYREILSPLGAKVFEGNRRLSSTYPSDAAYNIARLGTFAFHRLDITDKVAKAGLIEQQIRLLSVAQGYSKCNICMITHQSLITSDAGIAKVALEAGLQVLKIRAGHISLEGYSYGFFGGATGMLAPERLAVAGNLLHSHPDAAQILDFCAKNNVKVVNLSDDMVRDIGSIIPLTQIGTNQQL